MIYKAICPSNISTIPTLRKNHVTMDNFLDKMGINVTIKPTEYEISRVADIFEQAGIIVRIPNYALQSELKEQYYITNPSLTCQLIKSLYGLSNIENSILGHVFESSIAVQLFTNRLSEHNIFFYNNGAEPNNPNNKELDIILIDKEEDFAYFFECKFKEDDNIKPNTTLLSGYLEKHEFEGVEVEGRYVVYNGNPSVKKYSSVGNVIFTPICKFLDNYFEFEENIKKIRSQPVNSSKNSHTR